MFNLGAGEVVVLILLGVIFLGPKLSELFDGTTRAQWSRSDWFVVGGVLVLGTVSLCLATTGR